MLNALWAFMMLTGLGWAAVHGTLGAVTEGMLAAAGDAVSLGITMLGVMAFWTGILEIGRRAGLIEQLSAGMRPVLHFLFPRIPAGHPALSSMAANMIANMLGLGWAATPAGLNIFPSPLSAASLRELEEERRAAGDPAAVTQGTASDEMCTFLVVNISSLQLIPINMIAYRSQYGSAHPLAVAGPAFLATCVSTLAGVAVCRVMCRRKQYKSIKKDGWK